jgi:hypothetical protein
LNLLSDQFLRILTSVRFLHDLPRWRSLLPDEEDRIVYDEVITSIWDRLPRFKSLPEDDIDHLEKSGLQNLMSLFSNLVSDMGLQNTMSSPEFPLDGSHSHRLHWIKRLQEDADKDLNDQGTYRGSGNFPPATKGRRQKGKNVWDGEQPKTVEEKSHLVEVAMLMAGAIFGVVLAFLLSESTPFL